MAHLTKDWTPDVAMQLKDAGLVKVDDICQVDSTDVILDLGAGRFDGRVIVDASAVEVDSGDESYFIHLEFSASATFASGILMGPGIVLGDAGSTLFVNADTDNGTGRYEIAFSNEMAGTIYRYARLAIDCSGTQATGINFTAWLAKA